MSAVKAITITSGRGKGQQDYDDRKVLRQIKVTLACKEQLTCKIKTSTIRVKCEVQQTVQSPQQ